MWEVIEYQLGMVEGWAKIHSGGPVSWRFSFGSVTLFYCLTKADKGTPPEFWQVKRFTVDR